MTDSSKALTVRAHLRWWARLWTRVRGWRPSDTSARLALPAPVAALPDETERNVSAESEAWLQTLLSACIEGSRLDEAGDAGFWQHIESMWTAGDELLAGQWIEKFLDLGSLDQEVATKMRLRLVQMFEERGDLGPVLAHLGALTRVADHASDAHYYLAEHYRRRGDELHALREYEAVLSRDVDYPNVRQRYQRLRDARGNPNLGSSTETMLGANVAAGGDGSRYLLVRELGRGAAGVVYLARDLQLEREVAVKLLHPHLAALNSRAALQTFFDEARVAASLRHPNIVAILDLDESSRRIVMELCGGGTLRALLQDRGSLPVRRALERHAQILSALDASHARGVVHRDLKPANLMFRRDPDLPGAEVVLGDFGIAHLPDAKGQTGEKRAIEGKLVGTMAYMAPEQRRGEASFKSDLYASAVVLFEMLTGRYPWSREQLLAGVRRPGDFALPEGLRRERPKLGTMLQAHIDGLGDPRADSRPDTTSAMKESRRLRDLAMVACREGDPAL